MSPFSSSARRIMPRAPIPAPNRTALAAFLALRRNILEFWDDQAYEVDVQSGPFLGRQQYLVNEPEAIRRVLVSNMGNYRRHPNAYRALWPLFGEGLLNAEGESWRQQRRTIGPAMAPRAMGLLSRHVVEASARQEDAILAEGGEIELLPHMQILAVHIAAQSMFSLEGDDFAPAMRHLLAKYGLDHAQPKLLDILVPQADGPEGDRFRQECRDEWCALLDAFIARRQSQPADPERPRDLFDILAGARDDETGERLNHELLRDEVATMMLAGHVTTASTLFWACYCCARLPELQDAIAAEAAGLDLSTDAADASLPGLVFARAVIDETLRLFPPAFLIVREALDADELAGHAIAPGALVSVSPWVLGRHRRFWTDADAFDPARFLPGAPTPHRFSYLPFGAGPRTCVGAQFALTEATLVLARMMRRMRFALAGDGVVQPRGLIITEPDRIVRFAVTPRD